MSTTTTRYGRLGLALLAAAGLGLTACSEDGDSADATAAPDAANEVFAEPADDPGTDPFTDSVASVTDQAPAASAAASPVADTDAEGVASVTGTTPGLYGGTNTNACDADALVTFLENDAEKAEAWAAVHGITAEEIQAFVETLTPVVLLHDTRVTNHGFRGGRATARQSVLQAGTAVLVDATGMPRVRCACGNPLADPTPVDDVVYVGDPWDGFDDDELVVTVPGEDDGDIVTVPLPTQEMPADDGDATPETTTTTVAEPTTPISVDPGCAARAQDLIRDTAAAGLGPQAIDIIRPYVEEQIPNAPTIEEQQAIWCQVVAELEALLGL